MTLNNPVSFSLAKLLKEKGFNVPVPHCYVHEKDEEYYFEFFSFYRGTFCEVLTQVFEDEKEVRNFSDQTTIISNESEIYFNYNQDIRKLVVRIYNGEKYMNDEKSFNMNLDSYTYGKLSYEQEEELKTILPNYNEGDFSFTVYQDIISAPTIGQVVDWILKTYGVWITVECNFCGELWYSKFQVASQKNWDDLDKRHEIISGFQKFNNEHSSPSKAYEAAINYCLTNLLNNQIL